MASGTSLTLYAERLRRAQAEIAKQGIDLLAIGPGSDLLYLTGINAHLSERLNLLLLPKTGRAAFIVPVLEAPNMADRAEIVDMRQWSETESPTALAATIVAGFGGNRIAVGDELWSSFLLRLQTALPAAAWEPAMAVMRSLRMQKDAYEIGRLREVAQRTDAAWHRFIESGPISGLTETETMTRLMGFMTEQGLKAGFGICASGPNSAAPHHHTGDRVIAQGDVVIFDWGSTLDGYHSDITRTIVVGEPTDEFRKVYEIVTRANQATFDAVRPGATCESLDRAARDLITAAGYGPQFLHRVGHGLGLDVHEEPYLVAGNTMPLQVGMCFSDEPGIYLEGNFGVRIEDAVICTETGAERLNNANRAITVMD